MKTMTDSEICGKCHAPGSCCSGFNLMSVIGWCTPEDHPKELQKALNTLKELDMEYFVFDKVMPDVIWSTGLISTFFKCTKLKDGRCSDYENRPATCINYRPMQDMLCRVGSIKGIPVFVE